jgi:hypothetical protein
MGRIELRYCTPYLRDGLSGTAKSTVAPVAGVSTLTLDTVLLNTMVPTKVPVGARFTVAEETAVGGVQPMHTVTARTLDSTGLITQSITFTPAMGAGATYTVEAPLTFKPQLLYVKIGDGDLKYSENDQYHYDLDRDQLDVVRQGADVPLDVSLNFTWVYTAAGTLDPPSPIEAIKGIGAADEWVSSDPDGCQPYSVDLIVDYNPPCATTKEETYYFNLFRAEKRDHDFKTANVSVNGKCNIKAPTITRGAPSPAL